VEKRVSSLFVTEGKQTRKILKQIFATLGPPLWQDCCDTQVVEGVVGEPDWDLAARDPDYEVDQRVNG